MATRVYLDWNATAPLRPQARTAMFAALELGGNPSSVHAEGRAARHLIEQARADVAALVGAEPVNVVFTSGGTEANMLALSPAIERSPDRTPRDRLLVSAIEHPSVLAGGQFTPDLVERIPVSAEGIVDLEALARRLEELRQSGVIRPLISIMFANNENGIVQPIANTAKIIRQLGGILHVDAVQALARIPFDINEIEADLLTISAHKIGGPKGVGALIKREESLHLAAPLMKGGGQERGQRAGTENVAAIAGFGAAAVVARGEMNDDIDRMRCLRDALEAGLKAIRPETMVFGAGVDRLPNTTLFSMSGMKAETAVIALDLEGVAVSSGAACSSGKVQASHVLAAMGVSPSIAQGAVRVSLGPTTTQTDVDCFLEAWRKLSGSLFKESHGVAA